MKCIIEYNLNYEKNLSHIVEKIREVTNESNIVNIGILPNICSENIYFTGKVSRKSKLFLVNTTFDVTNPEIVLTMSSNNDKETMIHVKIKPNFIFLISSIIVSITFIFTAFLLCIDLFSIAKNMIPNVFFAGLFLFFVFGLYCFICFRSKLVSKKLTKIFKEII